MPGGFLLFVLSLEVHGLWVSVLVNDVTVYVNHTGGQASFGEKINPVLISGQNTVKVLLGLPPAAQVASTEKKPAAPGPSLPQEPEPPAFSLKVQRGREGVDPGQAGILAQFEWKQYQSPLTRGHMIPVFQGVFSVGQLPWRPPSWMEIAAVQVDRISLEKLVRGYAEALRARDVERAARFTTLKFQEMARALDAEPSDLLDGFRRYLEDLMAARDWSVSVPATLEFTLEANSRLVRITSSTGGSPITAVSNGHAIPFDLTASWIGGDWRIVH